MPTSLHIAWLGPAPVEGGGVPGVATELLYGLAERGHRIDCFFPSSGQKVPDRLAGDERIKFVWGTSTWKWNRWYSRTRTSAFASGLFARGLASLRLRRQIAERHREDPYDIVYQFSSIESLAVPSRLTRTVPLVIHPETHSAGELRSLIAERRLGLRCSSPARFATITAITLGRSLVQRSRIRRARLIVCISGVFRDHLVRDYGIDPHVTVVVANPVLLERFPASPKAPGEPPVVLVLGRVVARKGIETVVALAKDLLERDLDVRIRVVGGPSLWSDYTGLLADLPIENAEYVGPIAAAQIPAELAASDVLLQASRYEPFALTVAEALAAGVPVIGTSEVGAIEAVDRSVAAEVAPGDVDAMARALLQMLERVRSNPGEISATARREAERLFAPELVCERISTALEDLLDGGEERGRTEAVSRACSAT
jgi:glycosyltransferase involved in cell wall biosynthesis